MLIHRSRPFFFPHNRRVLAGTPTFVRRDFQAPSLHRVVLLHLSTEDRCTSETRRHKSCYGAPAITCPLSRRRAVRRDHADDPPILPLMQTTKWTDARNDSVVYFLIFIRCDNENLTFFYSDSFCMKSVVFFLLWLLKYCKQDVQQGADQWNYG